MNKTLSFEFNADGSCLVSSGQEVWDWSKRQVEQTRRVARVCMDSRRGPPCDCTACQLFVAFRDWKERVPSEEEV